MLIKDKIIDALHFAEIIHGKFSDAIYTNMLLEKVQTLYDQIEEDIFSVCENEVDTLRDEVIDCLDGVYEIKGIDCPRLYVELIRADHHLMTLKDQLQYIHIGRIEEALEPFMTEITIFEDRLFSLMKQFKANQKTTVTADQVHTFLDDFSLPFEFDRLLYR